MVMVAHHLNPQVPNDLAFAESRVRPGTIAAEDVLHDIGALSIMSSDAQAMGRIGEVVIRTWQTAHQMKKLRGSLPGDGRADNHRARRYVAKYTICPAVAHGLEREIGSVEPGKMADLVLWQPALFGVRPTVVLKGGMAALAALGDPNASVPTPQPVCPGWVSTSSSRRRHRPASRSSHRRRSTTGSPTGCRPCDARWWRSRTCGDARRRTCREHRAAPDRSRPRHLQRPRSTASSSSTNPRSSCRWRSATSSSEHDGI